MQISGFLGLKKSKLCAELTFTLAFALTTLTLALTTLTHRDADLTPSYREQGEQG
jgi:hypothetical protein